MQFLLRIVLLHRENILKFVKQSYIYFHHKAHRVLMQNLQP